MTERRQATRTGRGLVTSPESGYIILTFEFHKEGGMWVGECRELGTATDGRSLERVEAELGRLVEIDLDGLEEIGERERFFNERGIQIYPAEVPDQVNRLLPVNKTHRLVQARPVQVSGPRKELASV